MDNHKPRILIVDDEPVMRTITESVLAQHEFEISTADSAEQAILMINEGFVPDLLLLDVLMPGMNGFEACRILRRQHRLVGDLGGDAGRIPVLGRHDRLGGLLADLFEDGVQALIVEAGDVGTVGSGLLALLQDQGQAYEDVTHGLRGRRWSRDP